MERVFCLERIFGTPKLPEFRMSRCRLASKDEGTMVASLGNPSALVLDDVVFDEGQQAFH